MKLATYTIAPSRRCEWCDEPFRSSARGRPARFCSSTHQRQAWLAMRAVPLPEAFPGVDIDAVHRRRK